MNLKMTTYTPTIRWRQGEYQAVFFLPEQYKNRLCPVITIPQIEFDFELEIPKKSAQEHIHPFVKRLDMKWGMRPCWIDIDPTLRAAQMDDGRLSYDYVFEEIRANMAHGIPTISSDMEQDTLQIIGKIVSVDQQGVGLRLSLIDLMQPNLPELISELIGSIGVDYEDVDLLVDLQAPNYDPIDVFVLTLGARLGSIDRLDRFRNFSLIGTGFPESMAGVARGGSTIPRGHWLLYRHLLDALPSATRRPLFGDYTITHPDFVALDMRMVKPAGKVIYTIEDAWHIEKGGSFRDNREQMHNHCEAIFGKEFYRGEGYSFGDLFISQCASKSHGPSSLTRWKTVGINHHMTVVMDDLANLHGSA